MNDRPDISFPVQLDTLADQAAIASLRTVEFGALVLLSRIAWSQDPPGSLPDDDRLLAAWAGLEPFVWADARPAVLRAFAPGGDGRLHNARLRAEYDRLLSRSARRSAAGRKAANARHHGPPDRGSGLRITPVPDADRMRSACDSHADRSSADSPPTPPPSGGGAPAPMRSLNSELNQCAPVLSAQRDKHVSGVGAGARAQEEGNIRDGISGLRKASARREVEDILRAAYFPLAPKARQTLPPNVVRELTDSTHATPLLAFYAVREITDACKAAQAGGKTINPIGMMISAFGAQRHGRGRPWEVPRLFIEREWESRAKQRAQAADLQQRVNTLRAKQEAGGSPTARAR